MVPDFSKEAYERVNNMGIVIMALIEGSELTGAEKLRTLYGCLFTQREFLNMMGMQEELEFEDNLAKNTMELCSKDIRGE